MVTIAMIDDEYDFGPPGIDVVEMFARNGCQAGFWLRRPSWRWRVCQVVRLEHADGGCDRPPLPVVWVEFFDALTGEQMGAPSVLPGCCVRSGGLRKDYRRIDPPAWGVALA